MTTANEVYVYFINGKYMVQLPSTPKSGNFKFRDVDDGSIYLYELNEIPKHYHSLVKTFES